MNLKSILSNLEPAGNMYRFYSCKAVCHHTKWRNYSDLKPLPNRMKVDEIIQPP